ncbi:MAG TPA: metallophosphoesterase family protein [Bacteroidia bacterium]|jgi:putative phosphoesterase|nr:metallophosphoesterase family protein [Bacteroidia bacterium]
MQKILLISDTHSYLDQKLFKYIETVDEVWHAGDIGDITVCKEIEKLKPLKAVFGNIDGQDARKLYPENALFMCEQIKVFITHIGGYPNRYNLEAKKIIEQEKPNLFICGHSHILKIMFDKKYNLLHLNPGACGMHGFHQVKTLLRFAIEGTEIKNMEIIELGKRA